MDVTIYNQSIRIERTKTHERLINQINVGTTFIESSYLRRVCMYVFRLNVGVGLLCAQLCKIYRPLFVTYAFIYTQLQFA